MAHIDDDLLSRIKSELIDGLTIDGAHHKQYALEQVLKMLAPDEFDDTKSSCGWDDGIAP